MTNWILQSNVHTFDGKVLLTAGTELTDSVFQEVIRSNSDAPYKSYNLLQYSGIKKDLLEYMATPPYDRIFDVGDKYAEFIQIVESISLIEPVLQSLDFLKVHDPYTYRHTLTVFALSSLAALYLIDDFHERVREASSSPSHDIGKMCVSQVILQKSTPMTMKERDILVQHTIAGYVIMSYYYRDLNKLSAKVARYHHERRDGSGYPNGLNLSDPLIEIVAACDMYDALISDRPYRPVSFDNRTALEILTEMSDADEISVDIVKVLCSFNRQNKPHYKDCTISKEKRGAPPAGNNYGLIDESEDGQGSSV
ncbi:MAG: HD domain-containing protein [Nitrospira sp.]|nr:HD domain-containing protein [Nitrospira sp.]